MELVLFVITALVAIVGAIAMLLSSNAVHSALFLLLNFCAIAVLYLLLNAPFLFAIQLIIYAGAIIVLFLFVLMLLGAEKAEEERDAIAWQRPVALVMGLLLVAQALYVIFTGATAQAAAGGGDFGSPQRIAEALFTTYLLPFEVTSVLILAALIGVVVLHSHEKRQV
jgi:NADH-quinone oxidoreductase subunit J